MSEDRRARLLEAAVGVFARHGFRKASMDEVARAAEVSRQGLYLHFPTKEDMFRETIRFALDRHWRSAAAAFDLRDQPLEERLVRAFDGYIGPCLDGSGDLDGLLSPDCRLAGELVDEMKARFLERLTEALEDSPLTNYYRDCGLSAADLAGTLMAAAQGFKYRGESRAGFVEGVRKAVRVLCAPLVRA